MARRALWAAAAGLPVVRSPLSPVETEVPRRSRTATPEPEKCLLRQARPRPLSPGRWGSYGLTAQARQPPPRPASTASRIVVRQRHRTRSSPVAWDRVGIRDAPVPLRSGTTQPSLAGHGPGQRTQVGRRVLGPLRKNDDRALPCSTQSSSTCRATRGSQSTWLEPRTAAAVRRRLDQREPTPFRPEAGAGRPQLDVSLGARPNQHTGFIRPSG